MKSLGKIAFLFFISSFLVFTAQAQVLGTVGSKTLTLKEFNDRYELAKKLSLNAPSKELFLEDVVRFEIGVQEALKKNLQEDPVVKDRMNQELYKALLERELGPRMEKITVNESEMKRYYDKNPELRSSHILIEVKQDATEEQKEAARKRGEEILAEVRKSKRPFEELVNMYTDDIGTKKVGGDVGWQTRLTINPTYYDALYSMKVNQIKGLVQTPFGFHIIKLVAKNSYEQSNKRIVRTAVFDEKKNKLFDDLFTELKKKYPVKLNKALIK